MTDTPVRPRPFDDMRSATGVLWYINRVAFHPHGYALEFHADDTGNVTGWSIGGDGTECWTFPTDVDDDRFAVFNRFLTTCRPVG